MFFSNGYRKFRLTWRYFDTYLLVPFQNYNGEKPPPPPNMEGINIGEVEFIFAPRT
jgi:hypothetical protein